MKKIIAILITMTMLFSIVSIMPAFAYENVYTAAWTQDFESVTDSNKSSYISAASSGKYELCDEDGVDGSKCFYFYGSTGKSAAAKVFIDKNTFELGKTYVYKADVYVELVSTSTASTQEISLTRLYGKGSSQSDRDEAKVTVPVGQWVTISSEEFVYDETIAEYTGSKADDSVPNYGLNARFDAQIAQKEVETDFSKIYVDNFRVEEFVRVKSCFEDKIDKDGGSINFNDIDQSSFGKTNNTQVLDYETNGTSAKIVSDKDFNGNGNSLYFTPKSMGNSRLVLTKVFTPEENLGKVYKVTMQIFPVSETDDVTGIIKVGPKAAVSGSDSSWGSYEKYSIGGKDSDADIKVNQWNEVSYTYLSGYDSTYDDRYIDGIGITYNTTDNELYLPYYLDNIVITPFDYFADADGNKVATKADAGYYADTIDADVKEGVISIDSYVSIDSVTIQDYDYVGIYVYRADNDEIKNDVRVPIKGADHYRQPIKDANGYINVLIEEIGEEFFGTSVIAVPYVIMRGETFWGDAFTYCVNDAGDLKWLGPKAE